MSWYPTVVPGHCVLMLCGSLWLLVCIFGLLFANLRSECGTGRSQVLAPVISNKTKCSTQLEISTEISNVLEQNKYVSREISWESSGVPNPPGSFSTRTCSRPLPQMFHAWNKKNTAPKPTMIQTKLGHGVCNCTWCIINFNLTTRGLWALRPATAKGLTMGLDQHTIRPRGPTGATPGYGSQQ